MATGSEVELVGLVDQMAHPYEGRVVECPMDNYGLVVDAIPQLVASAGRAPKLIYVIPNHQNPTGVTLSEPPKKMGASERHLSLKLAQQRTTIRCVAFGCGEWAEELAAASAPLDIAYKPVINEFRGRQSVEIHLVDWRVSQTALAASISDSALSSGMERV